jgi:Fe-S cluster biogenesis protein NfuA
MNSSEFQAHAEAIERLVQRVSALSDEDARTAALELLQSLMNLHGAVVSRIVEVLANSGEAGRVALAKLGSDPLISGLLVLYGVHPVAFEDRVGRAIEKVSQKLQKQSASVELVAIADTAVTVKIHSSGHGCGSSPEALKRMVEQAIMEAAPEVVDVIAEGATSSASAFVPLNMIQPATKEEKKYEESAA